MQSVVAEFGFSQEEMERAKLESMEKDVDRVVGVSDLNEVQQKSQNQLKAIEEKNMKIQKKLQSKEEPIQYKRNALESNGNSRQRGNSVARFGINPP